MLEQVGEAGPGRGAPLRQVLKQYEPYEGLWPPEHLPERRAAARARFADLLEHDAAQL